MSTRHWVDDGIVDEDVDVSAEPRSDVPEPARHPRRQVSLHPIEPGTEDEASAPEDAVDGLDDVSAAKDDDPKLVDDSDTGAPEAAEPRGKTAWWAIGALVLVLLLLAAAIATGVMWSRGEAVQRGRDDALAAARQSAVNLTSVDFNHAEADVQRVLDGATGDFGGLFGQNMDSYVSVVKQGKVVTTGEVAEAGLQKFDNDTATAVVAVKASVTNDQTPKGESRFYRLVEDMQMHDGRWLVARVEFVP